MARRITHRIQRRISRRDFLKGSALGMGAAWAAGMGVLPGKQAFAGDRKPMPERRLGATGEPVSLIGLGGGAAVAGDRERATRIVERALDLGITYIDTAAQYGPSEANIGAVMRRRRPEAFLASKSDDRSYDGTMRQFERSLENLNTDYLDLYQLHAVHGEHDFETALGQNGALRAMEQLQREGGVRYIGISAHKQAQQLARILERYPFDCVLMSLNAGDRHDDSMIEQALPIAVERGMGVIGMKVAAYDGRIFREDGISGMREALGYTLSHPVSTAIVGVSSIDELEENAQIAGAFTPFSSATMQNLESRVASYHYDANFFKHEW